MIRFIDMQDQVCGGIRSFTFLDTVVDQFLEFNGSVYWNSYKDFADDFQASLAHGGTARREPGFWTRLISLLPDYLKPKNTDTDGYIAGQPLAFTIYLNNGYCITLSSLDNESLTHVTKVAVKVARINYRYLKLDASLSDNEDITLNIEELIVCLHTISLFTENTGIPEAEQMLRQKLHRTL